MEYTDFLDKKRFKAARYGIEIDKDFINPILFDFQRDMVRWAVRKGRAAIFADTGLGKTFMQVEWARLMNEKTLIIAPLSVARQTEREAKKLGIEIQYVRNGDDQASKIGITNYEMISSFDFSKYGAVVLDESSILKSIDGKTRQRLIDLCADVKYRLCCTATPAPNDISEIANHAEFLGIMTRANMLATFFVHDDNGYRLKGHAENDFYKWMASWGMSIRKPSDIGYDDTAYVLPELNINPVWVRTDYKPVDRLFFDGLDGLTGRLEIRRATLENRVKMAADLINGSDEQWIVWCGLDDEQKSITASVDDCVSIYGSDSPDDKSDFMAQFQDGRARVMITKPKIAGFGMNFQNCHNMIFIGLSDSFESYYQCIRRVYRFGQKHAVNVLIVLSEYEDEIYKNVLNKEKEAMEMSAKLIEHVREFEKAEIGGGQIGEYEYSKNDATGENWRLMLGDSCERMKELLDGEIDFSVYSPPFMSLYTYSPTERDLGNSKGEDEFFTHYKFIISELLRATKPGRITACHVAQVPAMMVRDGYIGLKDFRGKTIQAYIDAGWVFHGEVAIDKDPQAQAIRTKAKSLLFVQVHKDSSWSRPALADFILLFRKPGENVTPIVPDINNEQWIEWARPIWYGIKESDTLQFTTAREEKDERHICPLQLGTIERCIALWSNKGETVFSPFAGIGSEGYQALKMGRKFIGCELKESYFNVAARNLASIVEKSKTTDLFSFAGIEV